MNLEPQDRAYLRSFLLRSYNLSELKDLAFDLGVDYQLFTHTTTTDFARDLISYFERRQRISCLLAELLKYRQDIELAKLFARLPTCTPNKKIQLFISDDIYQTTSHSTEAKDLLDELAAMFNLAEEEIVIVSAAWSSLLLLLSLPEKYSILVGTVLGTQSGKGLSSRPFEQLNYSEQQTWRIISRDWPPIIQNGFIQPTISWGDAHQMIYQSSTEEKAPQPLEQIRDELIWFDELNRAIYKGKTQLYLSPQEYDALRFLLSRPNQWITLRELGEMLVGATGNSNEYVPQIHTIMARLRRKIEPEKSKPTYILNKRDRGYLLSPDGQPPL